MAFGASAAAANAAQYAAAAEAYAKAAEGAASGLTELKAAVAALTADLANVVPKGGPGGGGGPGTPRAPRDPAKETAREQAKAAEFVYQVKQRYLRQQEKDEARAAEGRRKGAYAAKDNGGPDLSKGLAAAAAMQKQARTTGDAVAGIGGGKAKPLEVVEAGSKSLKLLAKDLGISKAQLRAPITAGGIKLAELAMGIKGMAQLSAVEQRASLQLRQLFKGIDPMPVVRAADRFFQVFNKTSVTGQALEGIFGRAFGFIFGQVEKLAPYAHTAFQGMVLAALTIEDKFGEVAEAIQPLTDAIGEVIGPIDNMRAAAYVGAAALGYVAIAAAPTAIAVGAVALAFEAVAAAIEQATKLYKEWDSAAISKAALGVGTKASEAAHGIKTGAEYDAEMAARSATPQSIARPSELLDPGTKTGEAKAAANATGKAYADGLAQGVEGGATTVRVAASVLAGVIDATVRQKTETHSPSEVAKRTGRMQPAGMAGGIREGTPDVAAAARDMGAASNAGGSAGASGGSSPSAGASGSTSLHFHFPGVTSSVSQNDIRESVREALREEMRAISMALGKPVSL